MTQQPYGSEHMGAANPQQGYTGAGGYGAPAAPSAGGAAASPLKANKALVAALGAFGVAIFFSFILGAFDIDSKDTKRFLASTACASGAAGFAALLSGAYTRLTDKDKPPTFGIAAVIIAAMIMMTMSVGLLVVAR